jgi:hypothetical protein
MSRKEKQLDFSLLEPTTTSQKSHYSGRGKDRYYRRLLSILWKMDKSYIFKTYY